MHSDTLTINASDGASIALYRWLPEGTPKAVVQIAHGMAEHAARYAAFAQALTDAGYAVYANDHRGHGKTAGTLDKAGHFADSGGWDRVVADLHDVRARIDAEQPGLPVFLLGHSMGSLLTRTYVIDGSADLAGIVLSGTGGDPGPLAVVGKLIATTESKLRGLHHRSSLMDKLTFGAFNKPFTPARTDFDWLSRDEAAVDAYIADPWCGFPCTSRFFVDLLDGVGRINNDANVARVRADLPIYLFSGEKDPVGNDTKGVQQVAEQFRRAGVTDVTTKFYPDGRHETLNETNREQVYADVIAWLDAHLSG